MPEWPVLVPASPRTHVTPVDIPDGPAPVLWPYLLHSVKQQVGNINRTKGCVLSRSQKQWIGELNEQYFVCFKTWWHDIKTGLSN